jgi:PIN domain nuclease of toxin-antitoxin system
LILLDTHVLWWLDQDLPALGDAALVAADEALTSGELVVSAISSCEIASLIRRGRLALRQAVADWRDELLRQHLLECPVDGTIAIAAVNLDDLHRDPADRLIVATALTMEATLLTADERILAWSGSLQRCDARV